MTNDLGPTQPGVDITAINDQMPESFLALFLARVNESPEQTVYEFVNDSGKKTRLSYGRLDERARSVAFFLRRKTKPGDRVGLMYAHSPDFIISYIACLYASCIPVPMNLPFRRQAVKRMRAILRDSGVRIIFTERKLQRLLWFTFFLKRIKLTYAGRYRKKVSSFDYPNPAGTDLALIQYTSGSTGDPKGVMVSHASMLANLDQIARASHIDSHYTTVSWLPSFHDMGFIAGYMLPVWANSRSVLMSPLTFLKDPGHWLRLVQEERAQGTFLPNFGLGMTAAKVDEKSTATLDLSCFDQIYCGSEPIRKVTIDRFIDKFSKAGLPENAIYPCYGMAEAVLMISVDEKGTGMSWVNVSNEALKQGRIEIRPEGQENTSKICGCGRLWGDTEIVVVDPDTHKRRSEMEVGELWVRGSIVAAGYWNKPEVNNKIFNARLAEGTQEGFLRTGDLGVVIKGRVYITGRLKDLIIIRGRNLYPHDLENVIDGLHPALRINNCAVFPVEHVDTEALVVIQEIRRNHEGKLDTEEVTQAIRSAIARDFRVPVLAIGLIPAGTLPKTTSGKIRRVQARQDFENKRLRYLALWEQQEEVSDYRKSDSLATYLRSVVARKTGTPYEQVDIEEKLYNYGVDSIMAVEITDLLESRVDRSVDPNLLWELETIADICREIENGE